MPMTLIEAQARIQAILRQVERDQGIVITGIEMRQSETRSVDGGVKFVRTVRLEPHPGPGAWAGED